MKKNAFIKLWAKIQRNLLIFFQKKRGKERFVAIISKVIAFLMRISFFTTKWKIVGENIPNSYHQKNTPFIVCLWHDRLMTAPCVWKWKKPLHVLASNHKDGRLMAKVVENFSMPAIYGSTGRGGVSAAKKIIRLIRSGEYVAIIPDGPRGPRHKLAPGVIAISQLAKVDIIPFSVCVKRYFRFDSWDKFILVWPFNLGVMVWEEPISFGKLQKISEEEAIELVESKINKATQTAKNLLNNA
ncbi:MAG: lysophospholipid acyltransferase family protein [Holosporaceae bacterium]|nr:lysophospholipid acyltransferase family protein [Holosporaceae bacterium]